MAEADLVPIDDQRNAEAIFRAWANGGKGLHALAREFSLPVAKIEAVIDQRLPAFDARSQLRCFKRQLTNLEDLSADWFARAKAGDAESAHIFCRINERISDMRGFTSVNVRLDPLTVQIEQEQPSGHDRIRAVLERLVNEKRLQNGEPLVAGSEAPHGEGNG